ncbi:hypothetical protein GCM10027059_06920 [Myceligenerans halotolerans]
MSGGLYGADIEALRSFADRVAQGGETLANVVNVVDSAMPAADGWSGPDGEEFRAEWTDLHAVRLRETAAALRDVASTVRENADDQQETSGDLSGGGGGVGSGVGGGAGAGGGGGAGSGGDEGYDYEGGLPDVGSDPTAVNDPDDRTSGSVHNGSQHSNEGGWVEDENGNLVRAEGDQDTASTSERGDIHHTLAEGEAGEFYGYEEGVGGEFGDEDGAHGSGSAGVSAGAGWDTSGEVSLSENGLVAEGQVGGEVGLGANAEGQVGYGDHLSAEGSAGAFVGGRADVNGGLSIGPDGLGASLGGEAFVGAEAGADVSGTVAGVTAGVGGQVYAGIGVNAGFDANVGWDEVSVDFELGAALGIGAGFDVSLDWSPADTVDAITDVGGDVLDAGGDLIDGAGDLAGDAWGAVTSL